MAPYLEYRSERSRSLRLDYRPDVEFRDVVDGLGSLRYPELAVKSDLVTYALLELVSNSLRAHREKGVAEPVVLSFRVEEGELAISLRDAGRGFDPGKLPYDLDSDPEQVDLMSPAFLDYRERNGGSRFGVGLYVAKRTFGRFRLSFVDRYDRPCPWFSGHVKGTLVEAGVALALPAAAERPGPAIPDLEDLECLEEA